MVQQLAEVRYLSQDVIDRKAADTNMSQLNGKFLGNCLTFRRI